MSKTTATCATWQSHIVLVEDAGAVDGAKQLDRSRRFIAAMARIVAVLPFGLDTLVAPTFLGFVLINGLTFAIDLLLLTLLRSGLHVSLPVAFTLSYLSAFGLSFALNRSLNFRSHAPVGGQLVVYLIAIGVNYVAFIAGLADGLASAGLEYHVARILAAGCEGIYMYCVLRWVVFRKAPQ
ncbi:MAG TPA: GtrA family protein [Gaiellaceae bacterium]|nr:GtrA family protein [Gaiellaceae bacterium]